MNKYREGIKTDDIVIKRMDQIPAETPPAMQAEYKPISVEAAWNNHIVGFVEQNVNLVVQDYTEESVVTLFDHTEGTLLTAKGLSQIKQMYMNFFQMLFDISEMEAPIMKIAEGTSTYDGSVFQVWKCPSSGITSAAETYVFSSDNKISRQNIAYTTDPTFVPTTTTIAPPIGKPRRNCYAWTAYVCIYA